MMSPQQAIRIGLAALDYDGEVRVICADGVAFTGPVLDVQSDYVTLAARDGSPLGFALGQIDDMEIA